MSTYHLTLSCELDKKMTWLSWLRCISRSHKSKVYVNVPVSITRPPSILKFVILLKCQHFLKFLLVCHSVKYRIPTKQWQQGLMTKLQTKNPTNETCQHITLYQ